ncbi:MAG: (Fe-S)-binding protein, partial [Bryobacteraceae bacterium]
MNPAFAETVLFLIVVCLSVFFFFRRLSPILRTILGSPKDSDFQFYPIGQRVRNFMWEVMFQGKVIKERPLPGLAHAFVFWGFCAFALVTLDHLAAGIGADLISPDGAFGRFYFFAAALFAIAVAVSILALLVRRFVVRPPWLGPLSVESGVIGLLIFVLMITYLAVFWLPEGTAAGRVNWWSHTLALLVFLPLIPHTKHLHLMLSPATIFLSRGSFSKIPPLEGDEDFGIQSGKDITNIIALQAFSCVECGRCSEHCPANRTGKVLDPKKIALGVREYLKDHGARGEEPLVGKYISEEALFQCTTCGACEYQCPVGIEHVPIIVGLRRGLVNTGKWEDEYGGKLFLNLERNGNAMGFASSEREKFIQKNALPIFDGTQDYCLWLGCMGSYDPQGREIIAALAEVMTFLNVTFGVLKREKCTGDPVRRLGNDYLLTELAESNLEQIRSSKVVRMVSICPHCVRTIGQDWREAGATVEIEHHSEFLAKNLGRLPADTAERTRVVFHDPCYLGRYRDVYEEPRKVIGRSAAVIETPLARERGFCCGAGGGRAFLGEEKGKRVNVERAEALAASGASTIGAACPFCQTMLRDGLNQLP